MKQYSISGLLQSYRIALAVALLLAGALSAFAANDRYSDELLRASIFPHQRLIWVGNTQPSEGESQELWAVFGIGRYKSISEAVSGIEAFIKTHPNSPWVPSLEANIGVYYRENGYFTLALERWQSAWNATRSMSNGRGRMVADFALINWLQLLSSLGRTDTMKVLFDETKNRRVSGHLSEYYWKSRAAYEMMLAHPEISYRCGTFALDAVAQTLRGTNYFRQIWEQPSPPTGFSMADLLALSDSNHLNMVAVKRPEGADDLVVPCVVHWKENHYAAIVGRKGGLYRVVDPTFRMGRWLTSDALNLESSGEFLVSADQAPKGWRILSRDEAACIFGKGYPGSWFPDPIGPDPTDPTGPGGGGSGGNGSGDGGGQSGGSGGSCSCSGMPNWTIMEPWCTPWIMDEPLAYRPAKGPRISFKLFYWAEGNYYWKYIFPSQNGDGNFFNLGDNWTCSWMNFAVPNDGEYPAPDGSVVVYASGGALLYTNLDGTAPQFSTKNRMITETNAAGDTIGYAVLHSSGAEDVYTNAQQIGLFTSTSAFFLSRQIAPDGNSTTFVYTNDAYGDIDLEFVIDGDGNTNWLVYTNVTTSYEAGVYGLTNYNMISEIHDPFGHVVRLNYGSCDQDVASDPPGDGLLTNVTDVVRISSAFEYATNYPAGEGETIAKMLTPYGATGFYGDAFNGNTFTVVTEPNGSHEMFFVVPAGDDLTPANYPLAIPKVYTDPRYVPTNRPPDNSMGASTLANPDWNNPAADDKMDWANSFYWNRQQFASLSTAFLATGVTNWDVSKFTTNDYFLPRMRHFNITPDDGVFNCLSMERDPSPDGGRTLGEMTWYDYPGKPDYHIQGVSDTPILKIKVLPDGTDWYQINQLDQWNNATNVITTYSANGTVYTRTNSYLYATNGQDLLQVTRADGVVVAQYGYNDNHEVLFMTNALGEVTSYTYDPSSFQLTSITQPNGQVTTYNYGPDGHLTNQIVTGFSTNYYTWSNDLICTHTDERGLTVTNSYDSLNRLTNELYPDGTSASYIYSNLDLVQTIDRMGHTTSYTYDPIREKTSQTDANGHTTYYGYCQCGALYSTTDALSNVTYFIHDDQGNLIQTLYPDGYSVSNSYNLQRQLVSTIDSSGMTMNNWYNNQGLLTVSSNSAGLVRSVAYDIDDRQTSNTDANHVSVTTTYDDLDRPVRRTYADGGLEGYAYTPNIPDETSYTNQATNVWLYTYDNLNRRTKEVCEGVTTNQYVYNGAGDLLELIDGNCGSAKWGYDQYGHMTNKLDATENPVFKYAYDDDNRLTNRWTPAKGTTDYAYDPVGNLTCVTYATSPSISLAYDADNRLTNMIDGIGTTAYTYDQAGQLVKQGGLWPDDTVNYTYQNRLRVTLSLAHPDGSSWTEEYGYDDARRLIGVESSAGEFDYAYDPVKLQRIDELTLPNGAYITNTFDSVARLLSTALVASNGTNLDSQNYVYNSAGQRISETNAAGDYRNYSYDNEGELTSAIGKESGGGDRLQERLGYAYDAAGNLNSRTNNALIQTFNVNSLNELTAATNTGTLTVAGTTTIPVTSVKVNGLTANHYADATFALGGFTPTNGLYTFTAIANDLSGDWSTNTSTVNVILTNSGYAFDSNGNMTCDGLKNFAYDDENQLVAVWAVNAWSNSFAYDGKMRRRIERDYTWLPSSSSYLLTNEVHFIYDGKLVVEERSASNIPLTSYTRGNDLSGALQRAGGIGGLLARTTYGQEILGAPSTAFFHSDGNGNITALMYPNQQLAAKYLYDPFGNMLALSGPLMSFNKYRFSSKEWNANAGLYYYGRRFYDPQLQRWVNSDPIMNSRFALNSLANAKSGDAVNGFTFVRNDPNAQLDYFGLCPQGTCDHWWISLVSIEAGGLEGFEALHAHAELEADPCCSMPDYDREYHYFGLGIGGGWELTPTFSVVGESKSINTPCMGWKGFNGFGRISNAGAGLIWVYGTAFLQGPHFYVNFTGRGWGLDLSALTTIGYWHVTTYSENNP